MNTMSFPVSLSFGKEQIKLVAVMPPAIRDVVIAGVLPRRSSSVCIFTAPLLYLPIAQTASLILVEMVVEPSAYRTLSPVISDTCALAYNGLTVLVRYIPSLS